MPDKGAGKAGIVPVPDNRTGRNGRGSVMEILYSSTRNGNIQVKASEALLKGLSDDGGLFVQDKIPALEKDMADLAQISYQGVAADEVRRQLSDVKGEELQAGIGFAYGSHM